ncbi:unnamed protein product [Pedinophyceae sp. YPF-701]|nr:unnamed protein product [Pedinophyceae sp. YPF-701]
MPGPAAARNTPPDELEELLEVALGRVADLLATARGPDQGRGTAFVLTRIDAESSTRTRDIQATSTFLHWDSSVALEAFCSAISVDDRQLRAKRGSDGAWRVEATIVAGGGGTCGPVDCTPAVDLAAGALHATARAASAAQNAHMKKNTRARTVFYEPVDVDPGLCVDVAGGWSPDRPTVISLARYHTPVSPAGDERRARRTAQETVRGLRGTGALRSLSEDALVSPDSSGVAARLDDQRRAWGAAGRFPGIAINVVQSNVVQMPWVFLTLPPGMRWRTKRARRGAVQGHRRLVAEAAEPCAAGPLPPPTELTWKACVDKFVAIRAKHGDYAAYGVGAATVMRCVIEAYSESTGSPKAMARIDDAIAERMGVALARAVAQACAARLPGSVDTSVDV